MFKSRYSRSCKVVSYQSFVAGMDYKISPQLNLTVSPTDKVTRVATRAGYWSSIKRPSRMGDALLLLLIVHSTGLQGKHEMSRSRGTPGIPLGECLTAEQPFLHMSCPLFARYVLSFIVQMVRSAAWAFLQQRLLYLAAVLGRDRAGELHRMFFVLCVLFWARAGELRSAQGP